MIPNAYTSLAFVGCVGSVRFGGAPEHINSGARLRKSRPVLALPSPVQTAVWGRVDTLPSPAIRLLPSLSTRMFSYEVSRASAV